MAKEIGQLNVKIGLDSTGFQNGISSLNREMRKVQSEFKLASAEMGKHGKELDSLKLKSDSLTKQTELQRQKVKALEEAHQKSVETKGTDAKAIQDLEIKLNKAKTQLTYMEQDLKKVNQEIELQSSSWYKLSKSLEPLGQSLQKAGKKMEDVGKNLSMKVTAPLVALGGVAVKAGSDFESAFAGVRKTTDATEAEFAALEEGIRNMSKEIPASSVAISEVAEAAAGQLGIQTENILGFTRVMIDLGESTNMSADEAATSLARLANITGMSQADFDRLGSAIVALGNNLATTEGEIVSMGLRLAGAESQIGLTEAEIMSFAGALSSVGIEAEAGGSAFSKVMIDMQLAVETGSEKLQDFAQVAGMSADEFSTAFRDDAAGAIIAFIEGLGNAEEQGLSAIKVLDDMGITEVRLRDALLRASGASDVFTDSIALGSQAWEENTALTNEAGQRYETTASQIEIAKNYLKDAGITIGEIVVPYLAEMVEGIKNAAQWFSNLNPETQETIVKVGALAAALGPLLVIGGKVATGAGSIISAFSKASIALAGLKTGAATATAATTGLASGFSVAGLAAKAGALLLNPWTLGIGAATVAGVALYKHLSEDSIPAIELFGDEVSESTKKAVGGFLQLNDEATLALNQLSWSGQEVTREMADGIAANFSQMASEVQAGLDKHHEESLGKIQNFITSSTSLSKAEQDEILNNMQEGYESRKQAIAEGEARIKEILDTATAEKRSLTKSEQEEINAIQRQMVDTGIKVLSENEVESKAILERMKAQTGEITAKQAAEDERYYSADEFAEYFRQFIKNGIFNGSGDNLQVGAYGQDMTIFIKPGCAFIEGYLYKIDIEPLMLQHKTADSSLNRIDRVIIRLDKSLDKRYVRAFILEGTPAEEPTAPELTRDENIYEISLAQVEVIAGKSFIEAYQITDERLNNEVCGLVTHLFEQVDTTTIFNEWVTYLNYKKEQGDNKLLSWQEYLALKEQQVNQAVEDFIFFLQDAEGGDITQWLEDFKLRIKQEWQQWFDEQQTEGFMVLGSDDSFINQHKALNQRVDTRKEEMIYAPDGNLIEVIEKDGEAIVRQTALEYDMSGALVKVTETIPGITVDKHIIQHLIYDIDGNLERVERSVN